MITKLQALPIRRTGFKKSETRQGELFKVRARQVRPSILTPRLETNIKYLEKYLMI